MKTLKDEIKWPEVIKPICMLTKKDELEYLYFNDCIKQTKSLNNTPLSDLLDRDKIVKMIYDRIGLMSLAREIAEAIETGNIWRD